MRKRWTFVAAVCVLSALPAGLRADGLVDRLPATTIATAEWAGRNLAFDGSLTGQALEQKEIATLMRYVREAVGTQLAGKPAEKALFERAWAMASIAWEHPIVVALTELDPAKKRLGAVLLIDLGPDAAAFRKELDAAMAELPKVIGKPFKPLSVGKVNYSGLTDDDGQEQLCVGMDGSLFFVTAGPDQAAALLDPKDTPRLSARKPYVDRMAMMSPGAAQFRLYADIEMLMNRVEPKDAQRKTVRPILRALGLSKTTALAVASTVVEKGMLTRVRLFTPAPHEGVLSLLTGASLRDADP